MKKNLVLMILAVPFVFLSYVGLQFFVPFTVSGGQVEIEIAEGTTFTQAMTVLARNNLVRDKNLFVLLSKFTGTDRKIRAGYYSFAGLLCPFQVFEKLVKGRIIEYEVTIVEGDTLLEIGNKLVSRRILTLDYFSALSTDKAFLQSLSINAPSLEGYLFPQTYRIPKGKAPESVLTMMVNTLRAGYTDALRRRAGEMGWGENQVLTLASIIEREAVTDEERPIISAVYHNRVKIGMPLQADPTAIYGIKSYRSKITRDDLRKQTNYNTYVIRGLPPGPIASPGIKSIVAALYPADVPYLYFVAKGDGTHHFSKTLAEHGEAIKRVRTVKEPVGPALPINRDTTHARKQ